MRSSIQFLFKYINKKPWFLLGYFAMFLECLTPIIATLLQRDLIDKVFSERQYEEFPKICWMSFVIDEDDIRELDLLECVEWLKENIDNIWEGPIGYMGLWYFRFTDEADKMAFKLFVT